MLIDTAFGLGDLKGLIHKLIGDKEIIVCNTHCHIDHVSEIVILIKFIVTMLIENILKNIKEKML
ncbi:MAG: hypothetical protein ACLR43_10615 [Faecalibacillus faecis]